MKRLKEFFKVSNLLFLVVLSVCLYGQNYDQSEELNLSFVTIITENSSKIYLDNELRGTGKWYGEILPGQHQIRIEKIGYEPVEEEFSIKNGENLIVDVEGPNEKIDESDPQKNYDPHTFITLNGSFSFQPQFAMGLTFGYVKKYGVFASVMTNFSLKGFSTERTVYDGEKLLYHDDPITKEITGDVYKTRLSIIVGGIVSINEMLFIRAGLGYGTRMVTYEHVQGWWFNYEPVSYSGIDLSLGLQAFFNKYTASFDLVTTSFNSLEFKIGVGITID